MKDKPQPVRNPFIPEFVRVEKVTEETSDVMTFRIRFPHHYEPGQFVQLSMLGIGECPISVASYKDNYLDLCIRNIGSVTNAVFSLKPGDRIGVRGPYGTGYPMKDFYGKNIILIGGGTGVASLRSVIEYIDDNRDSFNDVSIFFGFRSPDDLIFSHDFEKWKRNFDFVMSVDRAEKKWKGNVGVITSVIEKAKLNKDNSVVIMCGPPIMIRFAAELLARMGFDERQIWVSLERNMKCGIGKCGRCMVTGKYICEDGPVFNYFDSKGMID